MWPGGRQRIVNSRKVLHRRVQFPSEFPDVVDAKDERRVSENVDRSRGEPGEGGVGQVRGGDVTEQLARPWASDDKRSNGVRSIPDPNRAVGGQSALKDVQIVPFRGCRRDKIESIGSGPRDGELAEDPPLLGEHIGETDAAGLRQPRAGQRVQKSLGAGTGDFEFGKARQVENANMLSNGANLGGDGVLPAAFAPER